MKGSLLRNTPARALGGSHWEPRTWKTPFEIAPDRGASDATAAEFPPFQPTRLPGRPVPLRTPKGVVVGGRGDALAEMPSDKPRAQLAFKNSMIRGILQFTLRIAFRCVLHRCKSQDIRC